MSLRLLLHHGDIQDVEHNINVQDESEDSIGWGIFYVVFAAIFASIQLVLTIVHSYKVVTDITTKESTKRKILFSHRRRAPDLTREYKLINVLTLIAVWAANFYTITQLIKYSSKSGRACSVAIDFQATATTIEKLFLYLVLITRIYVIYKKSVYCYPLNCVIFFAVLLVIYNLWIWIMILLFYHAFNKPFGNGSSYPNYCAEGTPSPTMPANDGGTPSPTTDEPDFGIGNALASGMIYNILLFSTHSRINNNIYSCNCH